MTCTTPSTPHQSTIKPTITESKLKCRTLHKYYGKEVTVIIIQNCVIQGTVAIMVIPNKPYRVGLDEGLVSMIRLLKYKPKVTVLFGGTVILANGTKTYVLSLKLLK